MFMNCMYTYHKGVVLYCTEGDTTTVACQYVAFRISLNLWKWCWTQSYQRIQYTLYVGISMVSTHTKTPHMIHAHISWILNAIVSPITYNICVRLGIVHITYLYWVIGHENTLRLEKQLQQLIFGLSRWQSCHTILEICLFKMVTNIYSC